MQTHFGEQNNSYWSFDSNSLYSFKINFSFESRKMREHRNGKNDLMPFDECDTQNDLDGKDFQLSIHLSGGIFQSNDNSFS